jgi:hypothetical protein
LATRGARMERTGVSGVLQSGALDTASSQASAALDPLTTPTRSSREMVVPGPGPGDWPDVPSECRAS